MANACHKASAGEYLCLYLNALKDKSVAVVYLNKKGISQMTFIIIAFVLALIVLFLLGGKFGQVYAFFGGGIDAKMLENKFTECADRTYGFGIAKGSADDKDEDGHADRIGGFFCDICIYQVGERWVGDNTKDRDKDFMPDDCDANPDKPDTFLKCDANKNLKWDKQYFRCVIKS